MVKAKYHKFKQINRFLEFIEDILPRLPKDREEMCIRDSTMADAVVDNNGSMEDTRRQIERLLKDSQC